MRSSARCALKLVGAAEEVAEQDFEPAARGLGLGPLLGLVAAPAA
jgi:hypothetical protein